MCAQGTCLESCVCMCVWGLLREGSKTVGEGGRAGEASVRRGGAPKGLAGFGLTALAFGRDSVPPALFDAIEPDVVVSGKIRLPIFAQLRALRGWNR